MYQLYSDEYTLPRKARGGKASAYRPQEGRIQGIQRHSFASGFSDYQIIAALGEHTFYYSKGKPFPKEHLSIPHIS